MRNFAQNVGSDCNSVNKNVIQGFPRYCTRCGHKVTPGDHFCGECGHTLIPSHIRPREPDAFMMPPPPPFATGPDGPDKNNPKSIEKLSGSGGSGITPDIVKRWNWGAFFLNWIWGLGNRTYIALLCLIPFVNFVMIFILGLKGSEWAWKNKHWQSIEQFKSVQKRWALGGFIVWIVMILLYVFAVSLEDY